MIIKDQSSAVWQYYETSTDDGASSSRMSHLQPEPDHRPTSPPHHPHHLQQPPPPPSRRLGLTALASTLFVVAMSAGMATCFLLYVILSQVEDVHDSSAFIIRERVVSDSRVESSTLSALSVSTAISHFLSITTPIVFSLLAYRTAHLWLRAQSSSSADEEGGANRLPTPLHYGLLVRILNSSTILGLGSPAAYFIPRRGKANRASAIPTPRLLREAFAAAFLVYFLSHSVGLADIWLHAVSTVAVANSTAEADTIPNFGMAFNDSLCDPTTGLPCLTYSAYWGTKDVVHMGSLVASNSTNLMDIGVITLANNNDTAILVPTDFIPDWNFSATTYGARANCQIMSFWCMDNICPPDPSMGPAIGAGMSLETLQLPNSSSPNYPPSPPIGKRGFSHDYKDESRVMAYVGNVTVGSSAGLPASVVHAIPPNPGPVLIQLRWTDFQDNGADFSPARGESDRVIQTSSVFGKDDDANDGQTRTVSTARAQCELEFVRVRYGYSLQNQFAAYDISPMRGDPDSEMLAGLFWSPLIWQQMTQQLVSNVHQACVNEFTDDGILALIGQELSRLSIASAAGVLVRTTDSVSDASVITQQLVGRYPRIPVFVFAGLLYAYAVLAILLFLSTVACTSDVVDVETESKEKVAGDKAGRPHTALELAHRSLMDPVSLIAEQHVWAPHISPSQASAMSTRVRTAEMFGAGGDLVEGKESGAVGPPRLVVGLGGPYMDSGNPRFGVWRRPKKQIEPEYGRMSPSIASGAGEETLEGTTVVSSNHHGLPPAYASLGRGEYRPTRARSGSNFSRGSEYGMTEIRHEAVRVDFGRGRRIPEKDLSGLMHLRSSVSSEGSEASGSTGRTIRRNTGV